MRKARTNGRSRIPDAAHGAPIETPRADARPPARDLGAAGRNPRRAAARISPVVLVVVATLAVAACAAIWLPRLYQRRATLAALDAADPQARRVAAWAVAESPIHSAVDVIRHKLTSAGEPRPDVREAFVYALGHAGAPGDFDLVHGIAVSDASGYVRQAALLAAARVDPDRCRALLEGQAAPRAAAVGSASQPRSTPDPWDTLAAAQARLSLGDAGGVPALLALARGADPSRQEVACRALYKWLRPALVSAGRWPLGADVRPGEIWPAGLVNQVERRCSEIDLPNLIEQTRVHERRSETIRRDTARWTGARRRLIGILFGNGG